MKDETPDRSMAFFSREPSRSETAMLTWSSIALLFILATLAIGGAA